MTLHIFFICYILYHTCNIHSINLLYINMLKNKDRFYITVIVAQRKYLVGKF